MLKNVVLYNCRKKFVNIVIIKGGKNEMKMSRKTVRIITAVMMFLMILSVASTVLGSSWTPQANEGAAGADSIKNIINWYRCSCYYVNSFSY